MATVTFGSYRVWYTRSFMQMKALFPMSKTGIYQIRDPCAGDNTFNLAKIYTRCDMETDGGGWIVIQRRIANGTVNFT